MSNKKIGVFLCCCGGNISQVVDLDELKAFAKKYPDVLVSEYQAFTCSADGQGTIQEAIKEHNLDSVVIGCCTPKQYEELYRECIHDAGLNPYLLEMVNLREQCSYPHHYEPEKATKKGVKLLEAALNKVRLLQSLEVKTAKVNRDVAVIGGGIAGVTASLMLAKLGHKVFLIEKEPTIGGNMAKLVKTFPTDDCAMCTLSPKLDEINKNKNVTLLTYSEIDNVQKTPEGVRIKVLRKSRYVEEDKCTGCGKCTEVCPVDIINDYNMGIASTKKAAFKEFAAAVPNKYTISKKAMAPCKSACPVNQAAQGYLALVAQKRFEEAFQVIYRDNPLPTVCGRVCNHVCETECTRKDVDAPLAICDVKRFCTDYAIEHGIVPTVPQIDKLDKKVAIIGSGPAGLGCAHALAMKGYQVKVYEQNERAGGMLSYGIPSYRLPDEFFDTDLGYIKNLGVEVILNTTVGRDISFEDLYQKNDAVFLGTGLQDSAMLPKVIPGSDLKGLIAGGDFLWQVRRGEKPQVKENVVVIGGGNVAIDVARTVKRMGAKTITLVCLETFENMPAIDFEIEEAQHEGINIRPALSTKAFVGDKAGGEITAIECLEVERIDIHADGRFVPVLKDEPPQKIDCQQVYVAIGQRANLEFLGGQYPVELDNRRLIKTKENSTATNIEKIFAGGDVMTGAASVIGAVSKGQMAAEEIDCYIKGEVYEGKDQPYQDLDYDRQMIIEKKQGRIESVPRVKMPEIGLDKRNDFTEVATGFSEEMAVKEALRCLQCGDCSDCRVCEAACEAEAIDHFQKDRFEEIDVGAVVVATGFKEFDPTNLHYGYGKYPDVLTQMQFARLLDPVGPTGGKVLRASNGEPAKKIVMVQCVGSRSGDQGTEGTHAYCSRVCCMVALKHANLVKKYFTPDAEIYICYIDIRAFGKGYEEYFDQVKGRGIKFIKGLPGDIREDKKSGQLVVTVDDANTNTLLNIDADLVVLSSATEPTDNLALLKKFGIGRDESGFVKEFHQKIRPTDTMVKNVFVCGSAQAPKDIPDTIAQAGSAAASAAGYLGDGFIVLNPMIATVNAELCRACGRCEEGCEFQAAKVNKDKLYTEIECTMCEGCGKCAVLCPTGAISVCSSTNDQLAALMNGLFIDDTTKKSS
ncbi:MAG: FAD-dependent oxidoreductase [Bacteriovoracaceae bacterium]|nr:FAD-dependent oxidoreductase [Bacteriovoracaceae bacterium]